MQPNTLQELNELIDAGAAALPATLVIRNGSLINVASEEIYPADVAIYKKWIVAVGDVAAYMGKDTEVVDATGKFLAPGLIDGHLHIECSKLSVTSFAKAVVPRGTTSIISGLDETISVSGLEGLREVLDEMQASPLKVFWGAPFKTPYTFPESTISFNMTPAVHQKVQQWPECFGVWELVREFVQEKDPGALGAVLEARRNRLPVFGCAPMARGRNLNAYLCSGVRLDHESYDHEEAMEKIRNGMYMLVRESSVTHFLNENLRAVTEVNPHVARRICFCTDDMAVGDVLSTGHLDNLVRMAIAMGVPPIRAIQMASINSAEAYRIDHLVGAICPGRLGDILLVDSPESFNVEQVISNGKLVAAGHRLLHPLQAPRRGPSLHGSMKLSPVTPEEMTLRTPLQDKVRVLAMEVKSGAPFVRKGREAVLTVRDGRVLPDTAQDLLYVSVVERFGKTRNRPVAFCSGWKLKAGAMATSNAPDDNNIVCIGASPEDMATAINHLATHGGGQVVVKDGVIMDFLPLPVGGIVSDVEPEEMADMERRSDDAARALGCDLPYPFLYMSFLLVTAIPDYAMTDLGAIDCIGLKVIDPILGRA